MQALSKREIPVNQQPLNQRLKGYSTDDVEKYWKQLDRDALDREKHFLFLDLVFPLLYGTAFLISMILAWKMHGKLPSVWYILLVLITVIADWTENLIQIGQLERFVTNASLQAGWFRLASMATIIKLIAFVVMSLFLLIVVMKQGK